MGDTPPSYGRYTFTPLEEPSCEDAYQRKIIDSINKIDNSPHTLVDIRIDCPIPIQFQ